MHLLQSGLSRLAKLAPAIVATLALAKPAEAAKPNIIFIMADDLGYAELGSYGQKKIKTPHLDRLAKQGMRFTRNYSGNAVCAPSRCVLMTGKHPGHAFVRNNGEIKPEGQRPIPRDEITMAELLRDQGYATGAFGKWGLGFPGSEGDPIHQGFDRFYGYNCQRHAHSYYPNYLWSNLKRVPLNNEPPVPGHASLPKGADPADPRSYDVFKGKDYAPDRINEQALKFIRDHREKPFFLYYPTVIPHVALHVPDEELKPYLAQKWNDPPFTRARGYGYTPHFTPRAAYAAMITRMDRYIGRVLDLLDELGLAKNTIVVFTSDNGTTYPALTRRSRNSTRATTTMTTRFERSSEVAVCSGLSSTTDGSCFSRSKPVSTSACLRACGIGFTASRTATSHASDSLKTPADGFHTTARQTVAYPWRSLRRWHQVRQLHFPLRPVRPETRSRVWLNAITA